jgi:hypothetical protein
MTIDKRNFDAAARALSRQVETLALVALSANGFDGYSAHSDAPNLTADVPVGHLSALAGSWLREDGLKLFHVFDGGVDSIIYSSPRVNYLFRAWHDLVHLELWKGFSEADEIAVAQHQAQSIEPGLLREIFLADTVGQTLFASATGGGFVADQRGFVFDVLNMGIQDAIERHAAVLKAAQVAIAHAQRDTVPSGWAAFAEAVA